MSHLEAAWRLGGRVSCSPGRVVLVPVLVLVLVSQVCN